MHLLVREEVSLDEAAEPQDLNLPPAEFLALSFSDSDLAMLRQGAGAVTANFVNLARLRHPISVDLFLEKTLPGTKAVLVRLLGGLEYWRYGAEELARACSRLGITLAMVPGCDRDDPRLPVLSTLQPRELDVIDRLMRAGGAQNASAAIEALLARAAGAPIDKAEVTACGLPAFGLYREIIASDHFAAAAVIFYRSFLAAGDVAPIDALCEALAANGLAVSAYFVPSLKDAAASQWLAARLLAHKPHVIVNTTAFCARGEGAGSPLDAADCPVLQVAMAGNSKAAWEASARGMSATDLAMHVVLPEIDGRVFAGVLSFKEDAEVDGAGAKAEPRHTAFAPGISRAAELAAAWARIAKTPAGDKVVALMLSTYPGRKDQIAHAVGLDGPQSAVAIAKRLAQAGYAVATLPEPAALIEALAARPLRWPLADYRSAFEALPEPFQAAVTMAWGDPEDDPAVSEGAFCLPVAAYGKFLLALQPDRGSLSDRKSGYHDPSLPPRHGYIAVYLWLRIVARSSALIHLGAHGTLEWLPGKAVALSPACPPYALLGPTPFVYPYIVNDPGEAAHAKRRLGAVTIGHDTPPLVCSTPAPELAELERLIDEVAASDGLDRTRKQRLARQILDHVRVAGLAEACGLSPCLSEADALARIDAFLCDVKEMAIRDGLHVLEDHELDAITRALQGKFVEPGPAGAPSRGRADVLPTGRNLFSLDPRGLPTQLAFENGVRLADALVQRYAEDHGDWPRAMVLDLWGSQTLRTGGEELAAALWLIGVRPIWNANSFRVTGFEVLPTAKLGRPRLDVTLRVSGLARDLYPTQLTLFHAAVQKIAELNEDECENPLVRQASGGGPLYRIFGPKEGAFGTGVTELLDEGRWTTKADLAAAYLEASATAYAGERPAEQAGEAFAALTRSADCFVHIQDHEQTDVLASPDYAAHIGGFAAAAEALGNSRLSAYYARSQTPNARPTVRSLKEECARVLFGRALSAAWLEGQMRHGFAGAGEVAKTVDTAFGLAATSEAITSGDIERLYTAYLGDPTVAQFLLSENEAALEAVRRRFKEAIARSLWRPKRNDLSALEGEEHP